MRIRIRRDGNCSFVWTAICPICPKHPFLIQGFGSRTGFRTHALAVKMADQHLNSYTHRFRLKFLLMPKSYAPRREDLTSVER